MESTFLTALLMPAALAFIMMGMGLSLVPDDFKRIFLYPGAGILGLLMQFVYLPAIGFVLVHLFGMTGPSAVGMMILVACPGGPSSNLITNLAHGDTALSISLTAVSSLLSVLTIPLIVNYALGHFGITGVVSLPLSQTIIQILLITILPVGLGMLIRHKRADLAKKSDKWVKITSALFLAFIILAVAIKERAGIADAFRAVGPPLLLLNILMLLSGITLGRIARLTPAQGITISIETGIQNGTLGIFVAATLLGNSAMTVPSAIYSLIMFVTSIGVIYYGRGVARRVIRQQVW
jgi:BASS family bile acid:Na+ symporter